MLHRVALLHLIACIEVILQLIHQTSAALPTETLPTLASMASHIVFHNLPVTSGVFHEMDHGQQLRITEVSVFSHTSCPARRDLSSHISVRP